MSDRNKVAKGRQPLLEWISRFARTREELGSGLGNDQLKQLREMLELLYSNMSSPTVPLAVAAAK